MAEEESQASDRRLEAINGAYERFASWGQGQISGTDAIAQVRKIWRLEDEEGYWSERGSLAADATLVAASHSECVFSAKSSLMVLTYGTQCVGHTAMGRAGGRVVRLRAGWRQ